MNNNDNSKSYYNINKYNINNNLYNQIDNQINESIFNMLNQNNENNKNKNNDLDQALSLDDKFTFKNVELEKKNDKNNNLFCYVPEENIQGLYSIDIELSDKNAKFKYLKYFLGNKRNNNDNIYKLYDNNNYMNKEANGNIEPYHSIDNIFKNIFKNRKNFYGNLDIKKNLDKNYYIQFIKDITNKEKLLNNNKDIENYINYIYSNYKSMQRLYLSNIACVYLKERNIKNNNYYIKKNIFINSLFFLINEKISQMGGTPQDEIMFVGESGIGKTYSLYLYTYILRLNPFNIVISIFEIDEFIKDPCLYLQKEIAYSLYYICDNNSEFDIKNLYDLLIIDKENKNMNYDILLEKLSYLMSLLFNAYDNKISLYIIIDGFEKIGNKKEIIDKFITSLYEVKTNIDGTENKEFEERFKVIYFCNSDESCSDSIIKEKFKEFSNNEVFTQVNFANFFEKGIIFLEADSIYDKKEIKYFIQKNIISKDHIINNKIGEEDEDEDKIINSIAEYTNNNFKKILWLIKDDKIMSRIKESKSIQYYINNNLEEWLYNNIFKFDQFSFEEDVKIYHFIYSCQNLKEMNENLTTSFFIKGYNAFNYSLIIPQIIKNNGNFTISFKLKNKNLNIVLKYLDMDKLYKKINLNNVSLDYLIKEYSETKSAILRGLIIEEMVFIIFKNAIKEKPNIILNFTVQIYAKNHLALDNQISTVISNVEKSMAHEDDIFEKEYFFTNDLNEEANGIYFLSHKFPCFDCVMKNGKDLYLIQIKKTLMFEHIVQLNEDLHYLYLLNSDEKIFNELVRQNELKLGKQKFNTKLNFFIKLAKIDKKKFKYNFNFMFIYQAKESTIDVNKNTDELNIIKSFEKDKREISYKLEDKWRGPPGSDRDIFYINNDYFLKIKCYRTLNNIYLTSIDNFTSEVQSILRISKNKNFFSSLKE